MLEVAAAICGTLLLVLVWLSVLRTTLSPCRSASRLARWTVRASAVLGAAVARRLPAGPGARIMELCAPVSLVAMAAGWMLGLALGFALLAVAFTGIGAGELIRFFAFDTGSAAAGLLAVAGLTSGMLVSAAASA